MNKRNKADCIVTAEYLRNIFEATDNARQSILKSFPYNKMTIIFCQGLKAYLKNAFGNDIEFDRDEIFACIHGKYKRTPFEIKTWNGIVLTIETKSNKNIIEVFKPILNEIIGAEPICEYDYCSQMQNVYPTVEWNLHPNDRLYELVNTPSNYCGCSIRNFNDLYTINTIKSLKEQLLTKEGYYLIFGDKNTNIKYHLHKFSLIQVLRPDINDIELCNWISNYQNKSFDKQLIKR